MPRGRPGGTGTPGGTGGATGAPRRATAARTSRGHLGLGLSHGRRHTLARAHHGSVSKEQRTLIEEDLKAGRLPAVVADEPLGSASTWERSISSSGRVAAQASGLQRVGRAGHEVGRSRTGCSSRSTGRPGQTAVVVERMRAGLIESLHIPANPLDVPRPADRRHVRPRRLAGRRRGGTGPPHGVLRHAHPPGPARRSSTCSPAATPVKSSPSCARGWSGTGSGGAERTPRRPAARRDQRRDHPRPRALRRLPRRRRGHRRRVGELDEEMVYESRVGDVFMLGTTSWRIEDITHDRVIVTPRRARSPGCSGRAGLGRPVELGPRSRRTHRELAALPLGEATARLAAAGLDEFAAGTCSPTSRSAARGPSGGPLRRRDRRRTLPRRARRLAGRHPPLRQTGPRPWALCIAERLRERFGVDVQALHGDDGIVLRLPDVVLGAEDDPATGSVTTRAGER